MRAMHAVWFVVLGGCRPSVEATQSPPAGTSKRGDRVALVRRGVPTACDRAPRQRFDAVVVDRFDNDDIDDGGHRTEIGVRRGAETSGFVVDFGTEVQVGTKYTFFVDDADDPPALVEIRRGTTRIWNRRGGYAATTELREVDDGRVVQLRAHGETKRFRSTPSLRRALASAPEGAWAVEIEYADGAEGLCESLMRIGREDPAKTVEVTDPRLGPYDVPAMRWHWEAE